MSRIILAHQAEGLEPPAQRGDLHEFVTLVRLASLSVHDMRGRLSSIVTGYQC